MSAQMNSCTCASCPGSTCTCGCQTAEKVLRKGCQCGPTCACGPSCSCAA